MPWQESVSVIAAFVYGLTSFISPCVLPLIPAYLGILAGDAAASLGQEDGKKRFGTFLAGALFVLGFSLVFIAMGLTATALGRWLLRWSDVLRIVSGVLVILMGILFTGILPFSFLQREKRMDLGKLARSGIGGKLMPLLMGIGFAFGWTPCIGPVLSSVLIIAANQATLWKGAGLLAVYAAGLAIPFLIIAALSNVLLPWLRRMNKHLPLIQKIGGVLMILMGILMLTGWLDKLATL